MSSTNEPYVPPTPIVPTASVETVKESFTPKASVESIKASEGASTNPVQPHTPRPSVDIEKKSLGSNGVIYG